MDDLSGQCSGSILDRQVLACTGDVTNIPTADV